MSNFTKIKDLNLRILEDLDDKSLLNYCVADKYANTLCQNETFWRNRFFKKFREGQEIWKEGYSWREYYLLLTYYYDIVRGRIGFLSRMEINEDIRKVHEHDFQAFKLCQSLEKLIPLCWKLRYYPYELTPINISSRDGMIDLISKFHSNYRFTTFSDKKIEFYFRWYIKAWGDDKVLCKDLEKLFLKHNMIIVSQKRK